MAQARDQELIDQFEEFYRRYYSDEVGELARKYPREQKSLYVDWGDLYRFDPDFADEYLRHPDRFQEAAEEALRLYDLPIDVKLGQAHVRIYGLTEQTEIRSLRAEHLNTIVSVQGIVRKATDVRPKIEEAVFICQRCSAESIVPQSDAGFQEPYQCESCERQGPFKLDPEKSEFVDAQKLRIQESPEGLAGGETPQSIDMHVEDDITGEVTPGDHVTATGALRLDQSDGGGESPIFDVYMDGISVTIEDEEFEDMDITEEDKQAIVELSEDPDIYEKMVDSMAPSIYGHERAKLAMILQLFSGVTKRLPDNSRIRGDLHMLLIGDPGTGKCVRGDTKVTLADGSERKIRDLVEEHLTDPKPVDDGVYQEVDIPLPSMKPDGTLVEKRATKVWKRKAPDTMYRIRTTSGREVEITPSHPLFVQGGGTPKAVKAENLSKGDFIATPSNLPVTGDDTLDVPHRESQANNADRLNLPDEWQPWLARLIGYIVAEENAKQREEESSHVSVTNNNEEVLAAVADALDRLNLNYTVREPHTSKDTRELYCTSSEFVSFLENLEPSLLKPSADQRVPDEIMGASAEIKAAFLGAYVESNGHVSATQRELTVASMSHDLLENVRSLLLTFGISTQLHEQKNGNYRLRVSGSNFRQYVDQIGFVTNQHYEHGDRNPSRESRHAVVSAFETSLSEGEIVTDGGVQASVEQGRSLATGDITWDKIETIEPVEPDNEWVYDLEVAGTHTYLTNNVVSHNSQLLQYIRNIAPRSVYTSGKGSSSAGLTAAAVRDDFGDGQQWTLEAGALVLADQGVAAVDELDKMASDDRSAMHEALEQQSISVSKAGINATLKSRCALLGAANPKYGRFDQYEPIGEQIDLEPALISRFDLIFTVTDQPDEEEDSRLAQHILQTNYAGELNTQREQLSTSNVSEADIEGATEEVAPVIDAELLRKYVAYSRRNCFPTMSDEAKQSIEDFYVNLRAKGADEDAPVPVTARKLEALVRLAEASARVRLSDTVEQEDAERVIDIVRSCLQDIGVDPETGEFDADVIETGQSKTQRDRIRTLKELIEDIEDEYDEGAPVDEVLARAEEIGMETSKAEHEIDKLKKQGEVYQPSTDHLRTT